MLFIIAIYVNISHKYLQENLSVYIPVPLVQQVVHTPHVQPQFFVNYFAHG